MSPNGSKLFNPTDEHRMLRDMVRDFAQSEVEPQAAEYDEKQCLNIPLLRQLGELGEVQAEAEGEGWKKLGHGRWVRGSAKKTIYSVAVFRI